ncbi:hypothetical protein EV44_g1939 [Erysiphe necator]|uniref:DUF6604 domain-containing protein n=1 Tax=Uncinula necator TaxID=52586 RepID=A0A0B1P9L8_UNCNE|nr:hypothetical protein EV44_g1939 [Erysiphe necator]
MNRPTSELHLDLKPFAGFFERYAGNLGIFIDWITRKAIECGYQPKGNKSTQNANVTTRLKGKARQQIKKFLKNPSTTNDDECSNQVFVNVKELIIIANKIVDHGSPILIPNQIFQAGVCAITTLRNYRKKFNSFNQQSGVRGLARIENLVFENILKELIVKLQPCLSFSRSDLQPREVLNYEALEIIIGNDTEIIYPVMTRTQVTFNKNLKDEKIAADQLQIFTLFSYFFDFYDIHSVILDTWKRYKDGEVDSITSSVITNVSLQAAIDQRDGVNKNIPLYYEDALSSLFPEYNHSKSVSTSLIDSEILEWLFCREFYILEELRSQEFPGKSLTDPWLQYSNVTSKWLRIKDLRYMRSLTRFSSVFYHIRLMNFLDIHPYSEDEFTKGILGILSNKKVPIWLPFALRIFLDIDLLLRDQVEEVFIQLRLVSKQAFDQLARFHEISPLGKVKNTLAIESEKSILRMITGVRSDVIVENLPDFMARFQKDKQNFLLLRCHPILSGFTAFHICKGIYRYGVIMCNSSREVGLAWQIYMSMSLRKFPIASWPLMDKLMDLYSTNLKDQEVLSNKEILDLTKTIGKEVCIKLEQEESRSEIKPSLKKHLLISFGNIKTMELIFPRFSKSQTAGPIDLENVFFDKIMNPELFQLLVPTKGGILLGDDVIALKCLTITKFLHYFSKITSSSLNNLLFPFLTLQEQSSRVLLAIDVAQIINKKITPEIKRERGENNENRDTQLSTDYQSDNDSYELEQEIKLIMDTINEYVVDWACDSIHQVNWPRFLSSFSEINKEMLDHWEKDFALSQINIKKVLETLDSGLDESQKNNFQE